MPPNEIEKNTQKKKKKNRPGLKRTRRDGGGMKRWDYAMIEKKKRQETMGKKSHPKTLAPANDQLQSRPATVYEDEVKI